jgi:1,2-diacylglycerol 3-beta-galactosyltransferase
MPESSPPPTTADVLFLIADTGGGHRAAARAVAASLRRRYPARFEPVLLDPLTGPGSARLLRWLTRLYGPAVRRAPWLWGAAYRLTDSRLAVRVLEGTVLRLADRPVRAAVTARRPAVVVSFHPLTSGAAVRAARQAAPRPATVTVVTDLARPHAAWLTGGADWLARPPGAAARGACELAVGVPVAAEFTAGSLTTGGRAALRRRLGVAGTGFLAVVTGGGEGAGGLLRTARALTGSGVSVVVICGRNQRARRRLARRAEQAGGRLTVLGFVPAMADWLRCADVVVTKAGPGTIAEAACCGAPMLITSHLPGQETGNVDLVVSAGAGRHVPRTGDLLREIARLRGDPAALAAMRAASARLARPGAAAGTAALIAGLAQHPGPAQTPAPGETAALAGASAATGAADPGRAAQPGWTAGPAVGAA